MGNLLKMFREDALTWIRTMKTGAGLGSDIDAEDAVATVFRWLEHGYRRTETALSRPEWLRMICGYYLPPKRSYLHQSSQDAETTDNNP